MILIYKKLIRIQMFPCIILLLGCAVQAFGLYHVHSFSGVTEGGVLGLTLLFDHHFHISPAVSSFVMNVFCYIFGWRVLGGGFVFYSVISGVGFSVFYAIFEQFPPLWTELADMPFLAALVGAAFIGIGAGMCVRVGGAPGGDDALAMGISRLTKWDIQWIYLISDCIVLGLSATYLPLDRLGWSLLSVVLSGQIIGWMQKLSIPGLTPDTKQRKA